MVDPVAEAEKALRLIHHSNQMELLGVEFIMQRIRTRGMDLVVALSELQCRYMADFSSFLIWDISSLDVGPRLLELSTPAQKPISLAAAGNQVLILNGKTALRFRATPDGEISETLKRFENGSVIEYAGLELLNSMKACFSDGSICVSKQAQD